MRSVQPLLIGLLFMASMSTQPVAAQEANAPSRELRTAPYRLQLGDAVEILYRFTPEYNQTVEVQPDGNASLQLIGTVRLAGLSLEEAHGAIFSRAWARLRNPELSLALKELDKARFTVLGEVGSPGRYELHGHITAVEGLAMAGGFKTTSSQSNVVLVHRLDSEYGEATTLDLRKLRQPGVSTDFPLLRNGDVLVVSASKFAKVERIIRLTSISLYYPLP